MSPQNALIVCFTFPPYPGIGGRRWAKFAKYLVKNGWDIQVLAAKKEKSGKSPWADDLELYKENIHYLPAGYPLILTEIPETFFQKIRYKLAWTYVKLITRGNYFDHSSLWKKHIVASVEKYIQKGFKHVVVTCGPFKAAAFIIELKKKYPDVHFMSDFRDPWTNNKTSFGYTTISQKRLEYERELEKKVVNEYDTVVSVSREMTDYFKMLGGLQANKKYYTLPNGFDRDDFPELQADNSQSGILRFVFTGTLYDKSMHIFKEFCDEIENLKFSHPVIYRVIEVHLFGQVPSTFKNNADRLKEKIFFHGTVEMHEVYRQIAISDLALLFLTDDMGYSFSTKFYEYVSQKIPVVVCSKNGATGQFVQEKGLGYACFSGSMKDTLLEIHKHWQNGNLRFNPEFNTDTFDISKLTVQLIGLLNEQYSSVRTEQVGS